GGRRAPELHRGKDHPRAARRDPGQGLSWSLMDTEVLIVGAGPTGLTLTVDLGMRGIRCTIVEQKEAPQFLPKMERCNARSMEIYRRMGLADRFRAAGLPSDVPMDVFIVLSLVE